MNTTIATDTALALATCSLNEAPQGATNHPALTPIHWHHDCGKDDRKDERSELLAPLAAAFYVGGARAVIDAARGKTRYGYVSRAWALAMTAVHGSGRAHESWGGQHPETIREKTNALASLKVYLSVADELVGAA